MHPIKWDRDVINLIQAESNWTLAQAPFAVEPDEVPTTWTIIGYVPDPTWVARQTALQAQGRKLATSLKSTGKIDQELYGWMMRGLKAGVFLYPGTPQTNDKMLLAAWDVMMDRSGMREMANLCRTFAHKAVLKRATDLQEQTKFIESVTTGMEYVSGQKALDYFNRKFNEIKSNVSKAKDLLAGAKKHLPAESYEKALAIAEPLNVYVRQVQGFLPEGDKEELETLNLGVTAVTWVAIGVAALAVAGIASYVVYTVGKISEFVVGEYRRQAESIDQRENSDIQSLTEWREFQLRAATSDQERTAIGLEYQQRLADIRDRASKERKILGRPPSLGAEFAKVLVPVAVVGMAVAVLAVVLRKK